MFWTICFEGHVWVPKNVTRKAVVLKRDIFWVVLHDTFSNAFDFVAFLFFRTLGKSFGFCRLFLICQQIVWKMILFFLFYCCLSSRPNPFCRLCRCVTSGLTLVATLICMLGKIGEMPKPTENEKYLFFFYTCRISRFFKDINQQGSFLVITYVWLSEGLSADIIAHIYT